MIEALVLLPVARLGLALCGFTLTRALFEQVSRIGRQPVNGSRADDLPRVITHCVHAAARHAVCGTRCLPRSLVLWALLRRQGFSPVLRFGARNTDGRFEAHAWVEIGGRVLDPAEGDAGTFVPFPGVGVLS